MRTRSRRRLGWPAAGALAVALGAPSVAHAQQSGLFPLLPINRERVPCANEDPIYKMYRHEYFGYHPTCWRKFPNGWGCPSPEAPNAAESFRVLPRDKPPGDAPPEGDDGGRGPGDGMPPGPGGVSPNPNLVPPLPSNERSPFDLDTKPNADPKPNANPAGNRVNPPQGSDGLGGNLDSPARDTSPAAPPATPAPNRDLSPPPPGSAGPGDSADSREGLPESQPLLALPDPTVSPSAASPPPPEPARVATPFQAPRRNSIIGGLFSGRLFRR